MTGTSRTRFRAAVVGAAAIAGFSLLGAMNPARPASGPASERRPGVSSTAPAGIQAPAGLAASPSAPARTGGGSPAGAHPRSAALPAPAHVVIVVEENASSKPSPSTAPYLHLLERHGAIFPNGYAQAHASQPNYLALFSGSTRGIKNDSCPHTFGSANLGSQLIRAGRTFRGYAESMPSDGYTGCTSGKFARAHAPWIDFSNVPKADSVRFARFPQRNFASLPTVSLVTPDLCDDMRDCSVANGDSWLKANLDRYASWAKTHNSLLIVAYGQADRAAPDRIALVVYGQAVNTGTYPDKVGYSSILHTIESMYGLSCLAKACGAGTLSPAFSANVRARP